MTFLEDSLEYMGCVVAFLFLAALFLLWGVIAPRGMWQALSAWQYKDPEANRPSEAAFAVTRVTSVLGIVFMVGLAIFLLTSLDEMKSDQQRQSYEECLRNNDDDEGLLSAEDWCEDQSPSPGG